MAQMNQCDSAADLHLVEQFEESDLDETGAGSRISLEQPHSD